MRPGRRTVPFLPFLLIVGSAWFVFSPLFHGEWQWDDNLDLLQNRLVHDPAGLWKIWVASDNVDYYPLKATVNWIQWRLWGPDPLGYHLTNVTLHALSALLFWRLLGRLGLKHAWWGGLIFAVHPLAVESVAWIAELKNTLSLPLLLLAMICYLDSDEDKPEPKGGKVRPYSYIGSLVLFLGSMLAKTSAAMFPFILLLYAWWRRGQIRRRDVWAISPFFAVSALLGGVTIWFQTHGTDVNTTAVSGDFWLRVMEAGQNFGFYLTKSLCPINLMPIYPHWPIGPADVWPLSILALTAVAFGVFWLQRATWGRAACLGLGFFGLNLVPVLGLIPMSFRRYSPVSDHFAYLPLLGIIGLAVAAGGLLADRMANRFRVLAAVGALGLCALLAGQSRLSARQYLSGESLWTYAVRRNPNAWVAHRNLGVALSSAGRLSEAIAQYREALRLKPDEPETHFSLGNALRDTGRRSEAIDQFQEALQFRPNDPEAHTNLAGVLADADRLPEAIAHFSTALALAPGNAETRNNFGNTLRKAGRGTEAIVQYEQALRLNPNLPAVHFNLALSLSDAGNWPEAIVHLEETLRLQPSFPDAEDDLGIALASSGHLAEAVAHFSRAAQLQPESAVIQHDLGVALNALGRTDEAQVHLAEAARLETMGKKRPE